MDERLKEHLEEPISRWAVLDLVADSDLSMGQLVDAIHALPPYYPPQKESVTKESETK